MVTLLLLRHGYSVYNKAKRFTGQQDIPLDTVGVLQAQSAAKYLMENYAINAVYSSDLCRAVETAKPVATALNLPITRLSSLREMHLGLWETLSFEEARKKFPENYLYYKENPGLARPDGGENYAELTKRVKNALEDIAKAHENETVLVATHGGVIRAFRTMLLNVPLSALQTVPHVPNASLTVVTYDNGVWTLKTVGYDGYLSDKATECALE